ncbi:alpha/beta hydrolase family protein [Planctomicrobium sp. SH661]|uniref:alpha/beta hydrolase family protein n=1 Tax=Planctomicrobium sp. SH661 TaxID=3448124 RepID=UPI003F5BF43F
MSRLLSLICLLSITFLSARASFAEDSSEPFGRKFIAKDSLNIGEEPNEDARQCLAGLCWRAEEFEVLIEPPVGEDREDAIVKFPSPITTDDPAAATAVMEWYMVRDADQKPAKAPAVVVIHESGRSMPVGRLLAKGFRHRGVHAFLLQLPGYGLRRSPDQRGRGFQLHTVRQGIADARRARDAVAALPWLTHDRISLQGTSLGGFVSSTAAGLDKGYDKVFLVLSGGDILSVLQNGDRDAARVKKVLTDAGVTEEQLREISWQVEPNRLAHRLNPDRTWLYSGVFDTVVPIENAKSFAKAASLETSHHITMPVDHYAGFLFVPAILDRMCTEILQSP